jgi:hypothetical protein
MKNIKTSIVMVFTLQKNVDFVQTVEIVEYEIS